MCELHAIHLMVKNFLRFNNLISTINENVIMDYIDLFLFSIILLMLINEKMSKLSNFQEGIAVVIIAYITPCLI